MCRIIKFGGAYSYCVKVVSDMMVGLIEFMYRLLNPIEEKSPRMYHFDVAYGQLIGMLLLSLICYQFYHRW